MCIKNKESHVIDNCCPFNIVLTMKNQTQI